MPRYVALLRGINVGGNSMMKMDELKAVLLGLGFDNVASYINSGNLAFDADECNEVIIEQGIEQHFGRHIDVMLRKRTEIDRLIAANPFAAQYESHKQMHVLFLKEPLSEEKAMLLRNTDFSGEKFAAISREIYGLLPAGVAESVFSKKAILDKKPKALYTGRNIRTVERLATL